MIESLDFKTYRKLKNISIDFNENINIISGTNGTCKSSILHIISNSFQKVPKTADFINDSKSLSVINRLNKLANPKLESLTRGDESYNDPARGVKGTLYECNYGNDYSLSFRRQNTTSESSIRFAVKPYYERKGSDSLPMLPIIYLGLFRLFSYGEFHEDELIKDISSNLPDEFLTILSDHYFDFTGYRIEFDKIKNMGNIKNRANFSTNIDGVDSNTISAGEDNLFIILFALVSLRFYFTSIESEKIVESILLVDELDASLHPGYQLQLFNLFQVYSQKYKIQIFCTSHSMTLLEHSLKNKSLCKLTYLLDNINSVKEMTDPDQFKINMWLKNSTSEETYLENKIPIISEDEEARHFINLLLTFYSQRKDINLNDYFHLVNAKLSSEAIKNLVNDDVLLKTTLRAVFLLDGDQNGQTNIGKNLLVLPGTLSPEEIAFNHACKLFASTTSEFWENQVLVNQGLTKINFRQTILPRIKSIDSQLETATSKKGLKRQLNKKLFNDYEIFWKFIIKDWIESEENQTTINNFFRNLNSIFKRTAEFHAINSNDWTHINSGQSD